MVAIERELPVAAAAPSADAIPLLLRRRGGSPRQVLVIVLIGTLVLAVFASRDLSSWLDRMGGGPGLPSLQRAAAAWDGAMTRLGLAKPAEALRDTVHGWLERTW